MILLILGLIASVVAGPSADKDINYKDQYCTDPRTMRKHAAYTEWADAYSCTRHRCQPGGRNLAIYTVGCKRVEAPESAIECEEVVEDTNMQFPFCCTRLRCLVVVRGEVWTRVLGQPWEVLPAAPWSHMYKMKKPPPADSTFLPKTALRTSEQGPIYELSEPEVDGHDKMLRTKKSGTDGADCNDIVPRAAAPAPDIVIALSTNNNDLKERKKDRLENSRRSQIRPEILRHKRMRKTSTPLTSTSQYYEDELEKEHEKERDREREMERQIEPEIQELEDAPISTEKPPENSDEKFYAKSFVTKKPNLKNSHHQVAWTEIPQNQWHEHEGMDVENRVQSDKTGDRSSGRSTKIPARRGMEQDSVYQTPDVQAQEAPEIKTSSQPPVSVPKEKKPTNLQALVDAIGTRMRDIENVVQRMSEKVHQVKPPGQATADGSNEKRDTADTEVSRLNKRHKGQTMRPNPGGEQYKRFTVRNRGSKYLHTTDSTTDRPLFIEDTNLTGYFSDASNNILRRANPPKEPPLTYMAPVDNRRKPIVHPVAPASENSEDLDKKRKKHNHKKRRNKAHTHKKRRSKEDKRKHFNRLASVEIDKNIVSLEDSSAIQSK